MGKILLIVTIVAALLATGLGIYNKLEHDSTKENLASTQQNLAQTQTTLSQTQTELQESQDNLAEMTTAKEEADKEIASLNSDLTTARNDLDQARQQVQEKDNEIAQLNQEIEAKDKRIADLETAQPEPGDAAPGDDTRELLAQKDETIEKLQGELNAMRGQVQELQRERQDRLNQVMRVGLEGRILAVNPSWNFVVLDLGDRNGVVNNAEMLVKRGNQLIGRVRITSVEPSNSIADIVANSVPRGMNIQPGDNVIFTGDEEL